LSVHVSVSARINKNRIMSLESTAVTKPQARLPPLLSEAVNLWNGE
jgi:hypothetical protein